MLREDDGNLLSMDHAPPSATAPRGGGGREATSPLRDVGHVHAALTSIRFDPSGLDEVLQEVAELAHRSIPAAGAVSVTAVESARLRTAASTASLALQLDQHQYDLGEGPCLDAARERRAVVLPDLAAEEAYPTFLARAREDGVRTIASVGLVATPRLSLGLNVYGLQDPGAGPGMEAGALAFADTASATVANAALLAGAAQAAEQLRQAMVNRSVIEQAKGLLVARLGCTPEHAFELLAEQSQQTNRKLREVAVDLVEDAQRSRRLQPPTG